MPLFDPDAYGPVVAELLRLAGPEQMLPLVAGAGAPEEVRRRVRECRAADFRGTASPQGTLAGLLVYVGEWEAAHEVAQAMAGADGAYWHGILHRQEPDAANAGYWFRRVGAHPVFPDVRERAAALSAGEGEAGFQVGERWDPFAFIELCERGRGAPGTAGERLALAIQRAEWECLFGHCARGE